MFDFDSANSPAINAVATRLTNGINEKFQVASFGVSELGNLRGGAALSVDEHRTWGNVFAPVPDPGAPDLVGNRTDFFRLIIDEISWGFDGPSSFFITSSVSWQVFGGSIDSVPEPAALAILGLGGLGFTRRRRKTA